MQQSGAKYWLIWVGLSLAVGAWFAHALIGEGSESIFMPGPLSPGHHQLEQACDSCHRSRFGGDEVLQEACVDCHGEIRKKPLDSHPRAKFTDPRNADRLEAINALACVTCHVEHKAEITRKDGVTQPRDYCVHCHLDIGKDRPSHRDMAFDTCANAGCHNFHDNRAIYTDFLIRHLDDPETKPVAKVPARQFAEVLDQILEYPRDRYPVEPLGAEQMDAPAGSRPETVVRDWLETAHARSGVNCSACHQPLDDVGVPGVWTDKPGMEVCTQCHQSERERFVEGRHGMRLNVGLAPMRVADARLPMREDAAHESLTCASCHGSHRFDVQRAALEACLGCHNDRHTLAYKDSPHFALWQKEIDGGEPGSGVSCATCHLPRIDYDVSDWLSRTLVDHNQSAALSPGTKMIRPACLHCHGLGFSIDALADVDLVQANFAGRPKVQVESMALARADHERYLEEMQQSKDTRAPE